MSEQEETGLIKTVECEYFRVAEKRVPTITVGECKFPGQCEHQVDFAKYLVCGRAYPDYKPNKEEQ